MAFLMLMFTDVTIHILHILTKFIVVTFVSNYIHTLYHTELERNPAHKWLLAGTCKDI
jgi:hypothetical protein